MSEKICVKKTIYRSFFEDVHDDMVFLISAKRSEALWDKMIYQDKHSYFDLPDDCWMINGNKVILGCWIDSYNHNDHDVLEIIEYIVDWSDADSTIFFVDRKLAFAARWRDFLEHWTSFIAIEDDCPIVMSESGGDLRECMIFEPLGKIAKIIEALP